MLAGTGRRRRHGWRRDVAPGPVRPSTRSLPRRASDPIVRASHKGVHARHAWRHHGGVDRVTDFKETAVLVWYRGDGVVDVAFRLARRVCRLARRVFVVFTLPSSSDAR